MARTRTETTTTVTDASATAAENSIAATGGGIVNVSNVSADPGIVRDALAANVAVTGDVLATGLEGLKSNISLVPQFLDAQARQTSDVLRASQENTNLASQLASSGAALARGAQTGGASSLIESAKPIAYAIAAIIAAYLFLKSKKG